MVPRPESDQDNDVETGHQQQTVNDQEILLSAKASSSSDVTVKKEETSSHEVVLLDHDNRDPKFFVAALPFLVRMYFVLIGDGQTITTGLHDAR